MAKIQRTEFKPSGINSARKIYMLHVAIRGTTPLVWRRILVDGKFTLLALHSVIQHAFGWQMSHLYEFQIGDVVYSDPLYDDEFNESQDANITIKKAITSDNFEYRYDFGDGWQHDIYVEDIVPAKKVYSYPLCIGGKNACPPEDCGGTSGFARFKASLIDVTDPEHEDNLRWVGGYYDPTSFDANRVNRDFFRAINWKAKPNKDGLYLPR